MIQDLGMHSIDAFADPKMQTSWEEPQNNAMSDTRL